MLVFPLIFITSFFYSLKQLISKNKQGIFIFLIFGLPIYTTSLSICLQSGFGSIIPFLQPLKEILVLVALGVSVWQYRGKFRLQFIDVMVMAYFAYTLLYVFLPIGTLGITAKAISFKSTSFFVLVYITGRLLKISELFVSKYFHYFLIVIIAATLLLMGEMFMNQHFQTLTGYADYNFYFFNQEPSGNFGLTWTYETSTGLKRFASFFANPLEYGAATLLCLAIIGALYTKDDNKFRPDGLGLVAILATQFSIFFAISRASLASYFLMIFIYALVTKNKFILRAFYAVSALGIIYIAFFLFVINPDLYDFIIETVNFSNPSSVGHVIAWVNGFEAIMNNPMGLGLGASGVLAESTGGGIGGENQYIIIGVQTGIISLIIYLIIHFYFIGSCWKWFKLLKGKERKICLCLLLIKIGFIIPMFTSELESSAYLAYTGWFLSGIFVSIIANKNKPKEIQPAITTA